MANNQAVFLTALLFAGLILAGCTQQTQTRVETPLQLNGLGTMCSGQSQCIAFCLNNRGQCEAYCRGNTENELCLIIFPPQQPLQKQTTRQSQTNETQEAEATSSVSENCTSNPHPVFTAGFTDDSKIQDLSRIGGVALSNPGGSARSYVSVKTEANGSRMWVPVYAPVNSTLKRLSYTKRNNGELGTRAEYRLDLKATCEVTYAFDHIPIVVDKLKILIPEIPANQTSVSADVSITINAGELLGYSNGNLIGGNWDFMVLNTANEENYINPNRWVSDHTKYATCPYDYFTDELKNKYYSFIEKPNGASQADCGKVSRDVAGTLAGGWFKGNSTDMTGQRLMVAERIQAVDFEIVTDGQPRFFVRDSNGGVIKPETITVGNSLCYYDNQQNKYAYLKLLTETEMTLVTGTGACPTAFPAEYEVWIR